MRRRGDLTLADLVHAPGYLQALAQVRPAEGMAQIDEDTFISSGSLDAVATALGAGLAALEAVALGEVENAFCAVRPPGHHAERERPMGFCLDQHDRGGGARGAAQVRRRAGGDRRFRRAPRQRHEDIFHDDPTVFYGSTHQMPLFPGTGAASETGVGNICQRAAARRAPARTRCARPMRAASCRRSRRSGRISC